MEKDLQYPYRCASMPSFVFGLATSSNEEEIAQFLWKYFYPSHPLAEMLSIKPGVEILPWFLNLVQTALNSSVSIIVRDESNRNQLVAVRLNNIEYRDSFEDLILMNDEENDRDMRIVTVLKNLNKDVDLFTTYDVDRILHMMIVAVRPDYENRGLASKLVKLSIQLCKQNGIYVLKADPVNEFAAKALMKYGFTTLKEIDLDSFEYNGTKPFANHPIHKKGRLMALQLKTK